jgi:hypothetical protein
MQKEDGVRNRRANHRTFTHFTFLLKVFVSMSVPDTFPWLKRLSAREKEWKILKDKSFNTLKEEALFMFEGEKTNLFWMGLIILGFASLVLFTALWQIIISYMNYLSYSTVYPSVYSYYNLLSYIPVIAGGIVFILIGFYMMKSGVKKPPT